jgi:hypothetical protein
MHGMVFYPFISVVVLDVFVHTIFREAVVTNYILVFHLFFL